MPQVPARHEIAQSSFGPTIQAIATPVSAMTGLENHYGVSQTPRICHLVGNLGIGGAERQIANLLNASAHLRPLLVLIDRDARRELVPDLGAGVDVVCSQVRLSRWPRDIWKLSALLKAREIQILHTHMFWPSLHGAFAAAHGSRTGHDYDRTWPESVEAPMAPLGGTKYYQSPGGATNLCFRGHSKSAARTRSPAAGAAGCDCEWHRPARIGTTR